MKVLGIELSQDQLAQHGNVVTLDQTHPTCWYQLSGRQWFWFVKVVGKYG